MKFACIYGTRRFIRTRYWTVFRARRMKPTTPYTIFKIHLNIILLSTTRFPKWCLPLGLSDGKAMWITHLSPMRGQFPADFVTLDLMIVMMFSEQEKLSRSSFSYVRHLFLSLRHYFPHHVAKINLNLVFP
jgi:hypothetical protein